MKCPIVEELKVEVEPQSLDTPLVIADPPIASKPKSGKIKVRMVKAKVVTKKSNLEQATSHLYDLEDSNGPEKCINIDFGLYQMEDY